MQHDILAATEMDVNCCLCRKTLTSEIEKKTRKRIHGASCREVKARLESISSVSLDNVLEINDPNAYLCRSCYSDISSIDTLEAKLSVQKSAVEEKLSLLHSTVVGTQLQLLRKRSQTQPAPAKRLRLSERSERAHTVQQTPHDQDHLTTVVQPSTSRGQVENPSPDVQVSFSDLRYDILYDVYAYTTYRLTSLMQQEVECFMYVRQFANKALSVLFAETTGHWHQQ